MEKFYVVELINVKTQNLCKKYFKSYTNACIYAAGCSKSDLVICIYPEFFTDK